MAPKCKAPKCANVKTKCQCPNAWTEFVSRNAADRKARGLKPATRQEHAAAYRAEKATGAFDPKPGMNNAPCKTDAVKLCAWNARRKIAGNKDVPAALLERRAEKIVGRAIAGRKTAVKTNMEKVRAFCKEKLKLPQAEVAGKTEDELFDIVTSELGLDKKHVKITGYIAFSGGGIIVLKGKHKETIDVAVKINPATLYDDDQYNDNMAFEKETYMHRLMYKKLPDRVPKHYGAFCKKKGDVLFNITIMELLNVDLHSVYKNNANDVRFVTNVARQLKDMIDRLRANKLVHGDMHLGNFGYKLVRGIPKLYLMDFGRSYGGVVSKVDIEYVWIDTITEWTKMNGGRQLLKALDAIKFPKGYIRSTDDWAELWETEAEEFWDRVTPVTIAC
jgi:tRNA A-37 threonylcarbamoyl transferase component Bud32